MRASMTSERGAEIRLMPIADGEDTAMGSYGNGGMFVYHPRGVCRALLVSRRQRHEEPREGYKEGRFLRLNSASSSG
jgi:hypothetical protein